MNTVIDLGSELLVDRSSACDPYLRLIVDALGKPVLDKSAWVAVSKRDLGLVYQRETTRQAAIAHGVGSAAAQLPRGERRFEFFNRVGHGVVSIHAPAWGATPYA